MTIDSTLKKRSRMAIAWLLSVAMVFATVSFPAAVANADTGSGMVISGMTKVNPTDDLPDVEGLQMVVPEGNNFIFIKQARFDSGLCVLWTATELTDEQKQEIVDELVQFDSSLSDNDDQLTVDDVIFFFGFGTFTVTPSGGNPPAYDYTFAAGDNGSTVLTYPDGKISHIVYGHYGEPEPTEVSVPVKKIVTGDEFDLEAGMFSFQIVEVDSQGNPVADGYSEEVANNADGTVPFSDLEFDQEGVFYYEISEILPAVPVEGIHYDDKVVTMMVTVSKDDDGNYQAEVQFDDPMVLGFVVFTNSFTEEHEEDLGVIHVTKSVVVLPEDSDILVNYTFYVGLFDSEGQLISEIKPLQVVNSQPVTVTFGDLPLDKTYYVYETDAMGNIIQTDEDGIILDSPVPEWSEIHLENPMATLTEEQKEANAGIINVFETEDQYYEEFYGTVTVNKTVTLDGEKADTNKTFYVALFADEGMTELASDVKAIEMNGSSTATVVFDKDKDGNLLVEGDTYYVAETDENGVPITNSMEELGYEIEIDKPMVVISQEGEVVNLVNKFYKQEEEYPMTGDSGSNMNLWILLGLLAVAGATTILAFRPKEEKDV